MTSERPDPLISWHHVSYDIVKGQTHLHIQGANNYSGLRFVWSLDTNTGERRSRYFIRGHEYPSLADAIDAWVEKYGKRKRKRVRLNDA